MPINVIFQSTIIMINELVIDNMAERFKLLGEPMRLKILSALNKTELCVQDLVDKTGTGQANISKHLALMATNGILGRRKDGLHVYYYIKDDSVMKICDLVCKRMENLNVGNNNSSGTE